MFLSTPRSRRHRQSPSDQVEQQPFFSSTHEQTKSASTSFFPPSIQRLATPEEEKMPGTNDERMREDKMIQQKPEEEEILQGKAEGSSGLTASPQISSQIESSQGHGQPLPENTRIEMEAGIGADLGGVNLHTDAESVGLNRSLGAQAFTHGNDIYFNDRKYQPESKEGKRLLAHELVHTVQQGGGHAKSNIQRSMMDWLEDAFNTRSHEAERDEWEDYHEAIAAKQAFSAQTHFSEDFSPGTGGGHFQAFYMPTQSRLLIKVPCAFNFVNGSATQYPAASSEELTWTDDEKMDWKNRFIQTVSDQWTGGNFRFHCQKDWWEDLSARTEVRFEELPVNPFYNLTITKVPPGAAPISSVTNSAGTGDFDSNDLDMVPKPGGQQIPAVHETGHILGLGDEYGTSGTPRHSPLAQRYLGVPAIVRGVDDRIMSGGMRMGQEHGVTFLEALWSITNMEEWNYAVKEPREVPIDPSLLDMNDMNLHSPEPDTQYA